MKKYRYLLHTQKNIVLVSYQCLTFHSLSSRLSMVQTSPNLSRNTEKRKHPELSRSTQYVLPLSVTFFLLLFSSLSLSPLSFSPSLSLSLFLSLSLSLPSPFSLSLSLSPSLPLPLYPHTCCAFATGTAAAISSCLNLNVFSVPSASSNLQGSRGAS